MTPVQLESLCVMLMVTDPSDGDEFPLPHHIFLVLRAYANEESIRHGYSDWIDAYHNRPRGQPYRR